MLFRLSRKLQMSQRKGRRKERSCHERSRSSSSSSSSSDSHSNNNSSHISERSRGTKICMSRRGNSSEGLSSSSSSSSSSSIRGSRSSAGERQSRKRKKREEVVLVETRAKGGIKKKKDKKSAKRCRKDENDRDSRERKKRHKKKEKKRKKKRQRREEKTKGTLVLSRATHDAKSIHHPVGTRDKGGGDGSSSSSNDSDNHSSSGRASKKPRSRGRSPENPRDIGGGKTQYEIGTTTVRAQDPVRVSADVRTAEGDRDDGDASSIATRMARAKAMVPMRPEEYAAQQSTIREVFDEDTGRWRLVRGTGEIIERIVSRQEQQAIQQHASRWGWDHKTLSSSKGSSASGWS